MPDSPVFDADNHYYEALDAFTRHLDPALGPRVIEWVEIGGRRYHALAGQVSRAVTNPTFNPIAPAGALRDYFRGNPDGRPMHELLGTPEPIRPEYRDHERAWPPWTPRAWPRSGSSRRWACSTSRP